MSKVVVTMDIYMYGNMLVNTKETELLYASSSAFAEMLTMVRGCALLILEVKITMVGRLVVV